MQEFRYIGIYNYDIDGFPRTKMIEFDSDINVVISRLVEHSDYNQKSLADYHISEYESNWSTFDKTPPVKIRQMNLSSYSF